MTCLLFSYLDWRCGGGHRERPAGNCCLHRCHSVCSGEMGGSHPEWAQRQERRHRAGEALLHLRGESRHFCEAVTGSSLRSRLRRASAAGSSPFLFLARRFRWWMTAPALPHPIYQSQAWQRRSNKKVSVCFFSTVCSSVMCMSNVNVLNSFFFFFFSNSEIPETPKTLKQVDVHDFYSTVLSYPKCSMNFKGNMFVCFFVFADTC